MVCIHCNQQHPEGTLFCPVTGQKMVSPIVCPKCGKQVDQNWLHCGYCGQKLIQTGEKISQPTGQRQKAKKIAWMLVMGSFVLIVIITIYAFWNGSGYSSAEKTPTMTPTTISEKSDGIMFVSTRDGNPEIYLKKTDTGDQKRISSNGISDDVPNWSPEKHSIAYVTDQDGNNEIHVMDGNARNPFRLTVNGYDDNYPDWSKNGNLLAFFSNRDGNYEIYAMNADGSSPTRLTNNESNDGYPDWSAIEDNLVFASDRDGNWEIYSMEADGSNTKRLTVHPSNDGLPVWSPDGEQIAFASDRDGNFEIYKMNADGSEPIRLTDNPAIESSPAWSTDGKKIAFTSNRDGNSEIYVMDVDGGNQIRITNNLEYDGDPDWVGITPELWDSIDAISNESQSSDPEKVNPLTEATQKSMELQNPGFESSSSGDENNSIVSAGEYRQWAVSAEASSQYGNTAWSASQAVGVFDVSECGDNNNAWASKEPNTLDWIELKYAIPVMPTEINIYQSFHPSQIVEVLLIASDSNKYIVWKGSPEKVENCPDLMTIIPSLEKNILVDTIRITIDQRENGWGWNEIDAVELVGSLL